MKQATLSDAYDLLHEGALAFADLEHNGIRIDRDYLDSAIADVDVKIKETENSLRKDEVYKVWRKRYGSKTNLGSNTQLADVLFTVLEYPCGDDERTATGRPKSDEASLRRVDLPFVRDWSKLAKWKKASGTFLQGIRRELCSHPRHGWLLRAFFNLHTTKTYRSSSSEPNFQNFPIRDKEMGKLIRTAFIPREGRVLVEADFSGIEVCIAACYCKDPVLMEYVSDKTKDMHRDMAMQCFKLDIEQVNKAIRNGAKNQFVFPEFYGSYYLDCAKGLWNYAIENNLEVGGVPLLEHLKANGIKRLGDCVRGQDPKRGTFEHHIKEVERDFWGRRFKVYDRWKKTVHNEYLETGEFQYYTGFVCRGVFDRKQVINYRIQGSAFHCLLWVVIQMNKWLRKNKMRTLIVGQIHDSIMLDAVQEELADVLAKLRQLMTVDLPKMWRWINVPLGIEIDTSETNWYEKKPVAA